MTLSDVLALRPGDDADSETLARAVAVAEAKRRDLLDTAAEAGQVRAGGLLTVDDKRVVQAEREGDQARLAAERIEALLPQLRARLGAARGQEAVEKVKAMLPAVTETSAELSRWWREEWPRMKASALAGLRAYAAARDARRHFLNAVDRAFVSQDVRDAAPDGLGITLPSEPTNPALHFLTWGI